MFNAEHKARNRCPYVLSCLSIIATQVQYANYAELSEEAQRILFSLRGAIQ